MVSKSESASPSTSAINYWLDFNKGDIACVGNSSWKGYPALVFTDRETGKEWIVPLHRQDVEEAFRFCNKIILGGDA